MEVHIDATMFELTVSPIPQSHSSTRPDWDVVPAEVS